jgi:predicted transcriptional regulator
LDNATNSLADSDGKQLSLFGSEKMPDALFFESESGRIPEFTAARLFEKRPETYKMIMALRAEGLSMRQVAQLLSVSAGTVSAVDKRESGSECSGAYKQEAVIRYRHLIRMSMERLEEILISTPTEKLNPRDLSVIIGVLEDKAQLLSGGPTARLAVEDSSGHDDLEDYLAKLKRVYAESMGSEAESRQTKGDGEKLAEIVPGCGAGESLADGSQGDARAVKGLLAAGEDRPASGILEGAETRGVDSVTDKASEGNV